MARKTFGEIIFAKEGCKDKWIDWIFILDFEIIFLSGESGGKV